MNKYDRKVFIVNVGFHNYQSAKEFGELVPVTLAKVNLKNTDRLEAEMQEVLDDFVEGDYLLLSGVPLLNVIAAGYVFKRLGFLDTLSWDPALQAYHIRKFDFEKRTAEV
jgi:hypothetical protein